MADLIKAVKVLNEKDKRCVYILMVGNTMFAATSKVDIDEYLKSSESIITPYTDFDDVSLLYGFHMDTAELPFDLDKETSKDRYLWLLADVDGRGVDCERFDTLVEISEAIETYMCELPGTDISNFAVILGEESYLIMSVSASGSYISERTVYG